MLRQAVEFAPRETLAPADRSLLLKLQLLRNFVLHPALPSNAVQRQLTASQPDSLRRSLSASTLDGVFATIFSNITGGVLLSNFLVELHANPLEMGMLAAIPMIVNLLQPLGAYLSGLMTSRFQYNLRVYGLSRLLWLLLAVGIGLASRSSLNPHLLIQATLGVVLITHASAALGSASWLSWVAALVPRQLRGRYFGIRNSAITLTSLVCVPLLSWVVCTWSGGSLQGYGLVLILAVITGLISIGCQAFMQDINPQIQLKDKTTAAAPIPSIPTPAANLILAPPLNQPLQITGLLGDRNFLVFLLFFGVWAFTVNLSAPFFNLYLLSDLGLDVRWVSVYTSLGAAANLLMMLVWGKLADRIGNRPILLLVGILVALTPLLWLGANTSPFSIWLWLPLLHILAGGTWAAIDLCINNLQIGISPVRHYATYFSVAAAISGLGGALGATAGGLLAQWTDYGGLTQLFALSSVLRLLALLPLVLVKEH